MGETSMSRYSSSPRPCDSWTPVVLTLDLTAAPSMSAEVRSIGNSWWDTHLGLNYADSQLSGLGTSEFIFPSWE